MRFVVQTAITIKRHFPGLEQMLTQLPDERKRPHYQVRELAMAVVVMFVFKRGSRNNADNTAHKLNFRSNIERVFGMRLPDLDTCNRLMKSLACSELENIKKYLVSKLISRKVFHNFRLMGLYYNVAIDGTGIHSYDYEPYPECPYKQYKSGKKVWTAYVLEAKIVCSNGFSISIATEWIKNPTDKEFDKQDCELKAFTRLAKKIKKMYPRLPVCITADGLYPNITVFNICKQYGWQYIITLKDGNLKTIWGEIELLRPIKRATITSDKMIINTQKHITEKYTGFYELEYKQHKVSVVEADIETKLLKSGQKEKIRFVHITSFVLKKAILQNISYEGRRRWKIENEGFNEQKNNGYNLKHKYSRTSFTATQNYYQCMQIAHIINQLAYKTKKISGMITENDTIKSFVEMAVAILIVDDLSLNENFIYEIMETKIQFRY